jgi:DNA-binding response OmpR family regulator
VSRTMAPPRVLVVMADQRTRALLRAELREVGYDALGARDLGEALHYPAADVGRGPVRLIIIDHSVLRDAPEDLLTDLLDRFSRPATLLLGSAVAHSTGSFDRVMQRPTSIGEITWAVQSSLPLAEGAAHPVQ